MKNMLITFMLLVVAFVGYQFFQSTNVMSKFTTSSLFSNTDADDIAPTYVDSNTTSSYISNGHKTITLSPTVAGFSCDGRQHCSQMTSCEEATYFTQYCPNTKMDGNHDGIPCEQQWCN